jgi:hypothetical protein
VPSVNQRFTATTVERCGAKRLFVASSDLVLEYRLPRIGVGHDAAMHCHLQWLTWACSAPGMHTAEERQQKLPCHPRSVPLPFCSFRPLALCGEVVTRAHHPRAWSSQISTLFMAQEHNRCSSALQCMPGREQLVVIRLANTGLRAGPPSGQCFGVQLQRPRPAQHGLFSYCGWKQ